MQNKRTIKDILRVSMSNIIKLLSGVLVAFLLPKAIGIQDYGYYKTFTLYATYVGLFHFGFIDGLYLKYGGKNYEELEKTSFRLFTRFLLLLEITISVVLGITAFLSFQGEIKFIFICLAVYLLSYNITTYFQFISQITSRFKELSIRNIIQSVFTCFAVLILWVVHLVTGDTMSYRLYTILYISGIIILMLWYLWTYRDITFGKRGDFRDYRREIVHFFILGIPLLVSNLCQTLLLNLDRQFVSVLFDTETYAVYSFAYNMISLISTALTAVSTVLYPTLKKANEKDLTSVYSKLVEVILIVVFACLMIYFPLDWFIRWFLPKYVDSLQIFRIVLPGLAISSVVTLIMHNYYKILNREVEFFVKSLIVLVLAIGANILAYFIFKTTWAISIASVIVMVIWYAIMEEHFVRKYKTKWFSNFSYMLLMASSFYLITMIEIWWVALLVYLIPLIVLTLFFFRKDVKKAFSKIFTKQVDDEAS